MAITKEKKEEILKDLTELFENAKSVVFSDYKGVSVKEFGNLRSKLRENEVAYKVAKKTLIKLAAEKAGFRDLPEAVLEGQVGVAFAQNDEIAAAKTLYEFSKDNENVKLLGALMEGRTLSQEETLALAKIPGKEELLAKLVGSMKSPITGFHGVLSSLLQNFALVVSAYKDKVEKEAPAEKAKPEETKAAEPSAEEASASAEGKPESDASSEENKPEEPTAEKAKDDAPEAEASAEEPKGDAPETATEDAKAEGDAPEKDKQ